MDRRIFTKMDYGLESEFYYLAYHMDMKINWKDYELYKRKFIIDPVATREQKAIKYPTDVVVPPK